MFRGVGRFSEKCCRLSSEIPDQRANCQKSRSIRLKPGSPPPFQPKTARRSSSSSSRSIAASLRPRSTSTVSLPGHCGGQSPCRHYFDVTPRFSRLVFMPPLILVDALLSRQGTWGRPFSFPFVGCLAATISASALGQPVCNDEPLYIKYQRRTPTPRARTTIEVLPPLTNLRLSTHLLLRVLCALL